MMINKFKSLLDNNYWLKLLDPQLNEPTNQNSIKVAKVVKSTKRKHEQKLWGLV